MRAAAVDIGTNSCRLLIAEKNDSDFNILERKLRITRLGEGVDSNKKLNTTAVKRVIKVLKEYKKIVLEYQVDSLRLIGTSALRDVKNPELLIREISAIGLELEIISGKKEAELNYIGAADNLDADFLLIDIGGGSTEFVWTEDTGIVFESLDLGCVRMTERFISEPNKAISDNEIKNIEEFSAELLKNRLNFKKQYKLKGVGGTITTLAAVKKEMEEYDSEKIEGVSVNINELKNIINKLKTLDLGKRKKTKGLSPKRADIIIAGLVILKAILNYINNDLLKVSDHDLLYGLLKEQF